MNAGKALTISFISYYASKRFLPLFTSVMLKGVYFHIIDSSYTHQKKSFSEKRINTKSTYSLSDTALHFMRYSLRKSQ